MRKILGVAVILSLILSCQKDECPSCPPAPPQDTVYVPSDTIIIYDTLPHLYQVRYRLNGEAWCNVTYQVEDTMKSGLFGPGWFYDFVSEGGYMLGIKAVPQGGCDYRKYEIKIIVDGTTMATADTISDAWEPYTISASYYLLQTH